jgi:hypothetical protein
MSSYPEEKYREVVMASLTKIVADLHDISLSLRAMSGRNIVNTNEPPKKEGYVERYFRRSDPEDSR